MAEIPPFVVVVSGGQLTTESIERIGQFIESLDKPDGPKALVLEGESNDGSDEKVTLEVVLLANASWRKLFRVRYQGPEGPGFAVFAAASREEALRYIEEYHPEIAAIVCETTPLSKAIEEVEGCDKGGALVYQVWEPDDEKE